MRRLGLALTLALALAGATLAHAAEPRKVKVGILKLTSSAPVFVGVEKGFFREAGVEPEFVYFQAAQQSSRRTASGRSPS